MEETIAFATKTKMIRVWTVEREGEATRVLTDREEAKAAYQEGKAVREWYLDTVGPIVNLPMETLRLAGAKNEWLLHLKERLEELIKEIEYG